MPSRVCVAAGLLRLAAARSELIHGREWVCRESTLNPFLRGLCKPSSSLLHQLLLEVLESVKACFSTRPFLCHRVLGVWAQKLQKMRTGGDLSVQFLIVTYGRDTIQRGQSCAVRSKANSTPWLQSYSDTGRGPPGDRRYSSHVLLEHEDVTGAHRLSSPRPLLGIIIVPVITSLCQ